MSEREQWDSLKAWLRENGPTIIAAVAITAAALGGWRWWQARTERMAVMAAEQYEQVVDALDKGDRTHGMSLADALERDHASSPYVDQANLAVARAQVEANELDAAAARLGKVMLESKDTQLQLIARLRLARVQLAQGKHDEALATLAAVQPGAFEPRFQEVRGDILHAKGDKEGALKEYRAARAADARAVVDTALLDLKIADLTGGAGGESATAARE